MRLKCFVSGLMVLLLPLSLAIAATQNRFTLPNAGISGFNATMQSFLGNEFQRLLGDMGQSFVVSGGREASGTRVGLTHQITAAVVLARGFYVSAPVLSHTYTASHRTFVYLYSADGITASSFTVTGGSVCSIPLVGGTSDITGGGAWVFVECATGSARPTVTSVDAAYGVVTLLQVDTNATAITTVTNIHQAQEESVEVFTGAALPTAGVAGRLALVTDDSPLTRGLYIDTGIDWVQYMGDRVPAGWFGISTAVADNGPAITTALSALDGKCLLFGQGIFTVTTSINGTSLENRCMIGLGKQSTIIRGQTITAPAGCPGAVGCPILDMSGTTNWRVENLQITTGGNGIVAASPSTAVLIARTVAFSNCTRNRFINVSFGGWVTKAGVVHGCSDSSYEGSDIGSAYPGAHGMHYGVNIVTRLGVTSPYQTITENSDVINNRFIGGIIDNSCATPLGSCQTVSTIRADNISGMLFHRTFINHQIPAGSAIPVFQLSGAATHHNLVMDSIHVEGSASIFLGLDANVSIVGLDMRNHDNSTEGTTTIIDASASGTNITGLTLTNSPFSSQTNAIKAVDLVGAYIRAPGSNVIATGTNVSGNIFQQVGTVTLPAGQTGNVIISSNIYCFASDNNATYRNCYKATYKVQSDLVFGTIGANAVVEVITPLVGVTTGNDVALTATPISTIPGNLIVAQPRVSSIDNVAVRILNPTASPIVAGTLSFVIEAHRY